MADQESKTSKRVLDPLERSSEVLFGVIMVLTFTAAFRVARANREDVREMLLGAIGCNLAWGLIDGLMYLMACVSERGHNIAILKSIHKAPEPAKANQIIARALPPVVLKALPAGALDGMREKLRVTAEVSARPRLTADDWRGAVGVLLLVFLSTFPVVLPFILVSDIKLASRISDLVAITMLFLAGHSYGRYAGHTPWGWGISMVALGAVMVGLTTALGG